METKRFIGNDLTRLYERVRREFGPDAVIVRTRSLLRDGAEPLIELIAAPAESEPELALDMQWKMIDGALGRLQIARPRTTIGDIEDEEARSILAQPRLANLEPPAADAPYEPPAPRPVDDFENAASDRQPPPERVRRARRPLAPIDGIPDTPPPPHDWAERPRPTAPARSTAQRPVAMAPRRAGNPIQRELVAAGLSETAARMVVEGAPAGSDAFVALVRALHAAEPSFPAEGETALVTIAGPEGSGRTTALIRMAMDCVESGRPTLLLAADTTRAGARAQLHAYGEATGIEVQDAFGEAAIDRALAEAPHGACVFADRASGGGRPAYGAANYTYLSLPASWQPVALQRFLGAHPGSFAGCIPTFVDLVTDLSPLLSVVIEARLALTFLSSGRDISRPLDVADPSALASGILRGATGERPDGRLVATA